MYKIIGKTCTGKTKSLLLAAEAEGGIVVCCNPDRMIERAHSLGIVGLTIISYHDTLPKDREGCKLFIDNLEGYVMFTLGSNSVTLAGYTLSCDE